MFSEVKNKFSSKVDPPAKSVIAGLVHSRIRLLAVQQRFRTMFTLIYLYVPFILPKIFKYFIVVLYCACASVYFWKKYGL